MKKKGTLSLLIVLVLCLALSGCGRKGKQGVTLTADSTGSVESSSGQNAGENTDDGIAGNTGKNADDSTAGNTGKNAVGSTGRNTGKTDTGSKTDKKTNRKTNKKTNKKTDSKAGQNTDNAVDNKSDKNTGKIIAQTTGSSNSTDNSSSSGTDSNAAQTAGGGADNDSGNDSGNSSGGGSGSSSGGGSGSSSGGGSTTPASPRNKLIESVADLNDITVEYGTDAAAAAAKLPGTVMLNCTDGSTIKGSVASWEVATSYNAQPAKQTAYTATGKVTIPDGNKSYYGTTLKATVKIIVRGGDTVVKSIKAPGEIEVAYGTNEAEAKKRLPSEVELTCVSGNVTFGTVTWNRKSGTTYVASPITDAVIFYTGTVKLPSGYRLDSSAATTIETTIIVREKNNTPKTKNVTSKSAALEIPIPYTTAQDEIEANLPDKVRLYCEDGSVITVTVDKTKWVASGPGSGSGDYAQTYCYHYSYADITLPEGYTFDTDTENNKDTTYAAADICVKKRDNTKLYAALKDARNLHENRIASREDFAGGENDKIYTAPEGTTPAQVTAGIKFIVMSGENKTVIDTVYNIKYNEFGGIRDLQDLNNCYKPNENQAFVDKRAEEINAATAALRKVLDNNYQIGTCFKTGNIVNNVKALLESESFKKGGNYAYDPANYPMILGQEYMLPQYVTVVVDAKGTKAEVELDWEVSDGNVQRNVIKDTDGKKLRNAVVTPTSTRENQPKTLSCVVSVVGYQNGSSWVTLEHEQVEAYNNCLVGAPLYQETSVNFDIPVLTSGTENTFTVKAAFPYYQHYKCVERIEPDRITAKNADNSITLDGEPLLSDITVTGVNTDQDSSDYVLEFTMTAATASLDAIVDQRTTGAGKVELSIPADAITLTEYAKKEEGWYLPEDSLELEAYVGILCPAVTVTDITLQPNSEVDVTFSTKYWSGSSYVQMALLQHKFDLLVDGDNSRILSKSDAVPVNSDDTYQTAIDTACLDKDTDSVYNLWVKVGDGGWLNTGKTCSLSNTQTHAAGLAGLAASPVLELPADGAEEEQPAVTVEDAQLSEDKSRVTVAFRTAHCSGSSVQTALVPGTEAAFDGTAAGSFVAEDVVTVEADGAYTADISASGIPAGDYTVWVKAGDGDWQKSTVTYTHIPADSDTDTDSDTADDSGTDTGTGSADDSGTDTGTGSADDSGTDTGTGSDADSGTDNGTGSDTDSGSDAAAAGAAGSRDAAIPENSLQPETEGKDLTDPDEDAQPGTQADPANADQSGE